MADINLLQNSSNQKKIVEGGQVPSYMGTIGVFILVIVIIATAAFYFLVSAENNQISSLTQQQISAQQKITSLPNYSKFLTEQTSLKALTSLIGSHTDWSQVPNQFSKVTVNTISYTSLTINQDGTVTIQGLAPTFAELDKYVQALSDKTISPFITAVDLKNVSLASQPNGTTSSGAQSSTSGVAFSIIVAFNKSIWPTTASTTTATATQSQ
jgi:Tfp pilus assembly protein PilN